MADYVSKSSEKNSERQMEREAGKPSEAELHKEKEIRETSKEFVEGVSELVEGAEAAEAVSEGEVSETVKEQKKAAPVSGLKGGAVAGLTPVSAIAAPSIEIMRIQVSTQVKKEIRLLEKEAARLMKSPSGFSAFKLNGVVAKIRELKEILAGLAYATVETIKGWWMKFVRGISI